MTVYTRYNVGDNVFVSYNCLTDENAIERGGSMTLDKDFPLSCTILRVEINANEDIRRPNNYKIIVKYTVKINSPAYHFSTDTDEKYFPEISCFLEEDVFKSVEEMEEYMVFAGTNYISKGFTLEDIRQIIKLQHESC